MESRTKDTCRGSTERMEEEVEVKYKRGSAGALHFTSMSEAPTGSAPFVLRLKRIPCGLGPAYRSIGQFRSHIMISFVQETTESGFLTTITHYQATPICR